MSAYRLVAIPAMAVLMLGCSSQPKHVGAADFQKLFSSRNVQTIRWYGYLGETNGAVYMLEKSVPLVGSKQKEIVCYTETNGLAPGFLEQMKGQSWLEQNGAAIQSQLRSQQANPSSTATGSGR